MGKGCTPAHYLAMEGSEVVIRAAHEVFGTEQLLRGKWAAMLKSRSKGGATPLVCLASRTDIDPRLRELFSS